MKISSKQIGKQIKDKREDARKERISLYVRSKTVAAFEVACRREGLTMSAVVEQMMESFTEDSSRTTGKG